MVAIVREAIARNGLQLLSLPVDFLGVSGPNKVYMQVIAIGDEDSNTC